MQPSQTFSSPKLRKAMVIRGLGPKDMAKRTGLHVNTILTALARGRCELETLVRIATVLDAVEPIGGIMAIQKRREVPVDMVGPVSAPLEERLRAREERTLREQQKRESP